METHPSLTGTKPAETMEERLDKPRIGVFRSYPFGGGQNFALALSLNKYSRLEDISLFGTDTQAMDWGFLHPCRIKLVRLDALNVRLGASLYSRLLDIRERVRQLDVLDTAEPSNGYSAQLLNLAKSQGKPVIVTTIETSQDRFLDVLPPFRGYLNIARRHAAAFRVMTTRSREYLASRGVREEDIYQIPVGIDLETFFPPSTTEFRDEVRILFARKLEEKNGVRELLDAFARLSEDHPSVRLWVVGDGPLTGLVREFAKRYPVTPIGRVSYRKLAEVYRQVDIYCNPGKDIYVIGRPVQEDGQYTFPLLEAMASGLPVVSTDSGSNSELLGSQNIAVPQADVARLADALEVFLDKDARRQVGQSNRHRAERQFDAAKLQPQMDELVAAVA